MWLFEITIYMILVEMFVLKTCTMLLCVAHEKWKSFNLNFDVKFNLQSPKTKEILLVVTSIVLILTWAQLNALGFVDACAFVCLITNCCKCTMLLCVVVKNEKRLVWVLIWNLTYSHLK
jgi:hypothetical protein